MSKPCKERALAISERVYGVLLRLYPAEYRGEYGEPMAQHFRDLSRDAWISGGGRGLALLWVRALLDLFKTAVLEHFNNRRKGEAMFYRTLQMLRGGSAPRTAFLALFGGVFGLAVCSSAVLAFMMPEIYSSTARISVDRVEGSGAREKLGRLAPGGFDPYFAQTQFERMQSFEMLRRAVNKLRTSEGKGGLTDHGGANEMDAINRLRRSFDMRQVRNTSLIEVRGYGGKPGEASEVANAVAETFREFNAEGVKLETGEQRVSLASVEIVDVAEPALRPFRPNRPLMLFGGVLGGGALALAIGGLGALAVKLRRGLVRRSLG